MARDEQELQHRGQRSDLFLLLTPVLSMLYHQGLFQNSILEEENWRGEVWKWDLHFVHLLEVRLILVSHRGCPDPRHLQFGRVQREYRALSLEGRLTLLCGGRKMQEVYNE